MTQTQTEVRERPILFSGPMVRAILDGRKTQTRRLVTPQPEFAQHYQWKGRTLYDGEARQWFWKEYDFGYGDAIAATPGREMIELCPYGAPGDRLAVREDAWMWCERRPNGITGTGRAKLLYVPLESAPVHYCVDHPERPAIDVVSPDTGNEWGWRKKLGRFVPRWASRITLEITGVRVERLQQITERDAVAEGFGVAALRDCKWPKFAAAWDEINGTRAPWASNPWVWVLTFQRIESNL